MKSKRILKIAVIALLIIVCLGAVALSGIALHIHKSAKQYSAIAQQAHPHPGNDIAALIEYMNSKDHSLRQRNLAVWTLGRLRNPAALKALKSVYTAAECDHETNLCQYELKKAIKLCSGTSLR